MRSQLAAFGLLAVLLPLGAVLLSGWVMFHMGADVKILAVAAGAAASAVAVALVLASSITRRLEQLSAASDRLAAGDLSVRAPTGGPRELAQLGRSFNAMASELESLFDARRELIAAASHDLRTPVASITAMLEAIEDGLAPPDEYLAPYRSTRGGSGRWSTTSSSSHGSTPERSRTSCRSFPWHRSSTPVCAESQRRRERAA